MDDEKIPESFRLDYRILNSYKGLSESDVVQIEKELLADPDNLEKRLALIGWYFFAYDSPRKSFTDDMRVKRHEHCYWMIKHQPFSTLVGNPWVYIDHEDEDYSRFKELWLQLIKEYSDHYRVLLNAANFFKYSDPDKAEELLLQATKLPSDCDTNYGVFSDLARLYERIGNHVKSLEYLEKVLTHLPKTEEEPELKFCYYGDVAEAAYAAQDNQKAVTYANLALKEAENFHKSWAYGNALHQANLVLGHIAYDKDDFVLAVKHLLLAGSTRGSPQLDTYGPDMRLARKLLQAGEQDTVIEYCQLCTKFWGERLELKRWIQEIQETGTSELQSN